MRGVAGSVSSDSDQLSKEWDESMGHMGQGEPEPVGCMSLLVPWPPIYTCVTMLPHTRPKQPDTTITIIKSQLTRQELSLAI